MTVRSCSEFGFFNCVLISLYVSPLQAVSNNLILVQIAMKTAGES